MKFLLNLFLIFLVSFNALAVPKQISGEEIRNSTNGVLIWNISTGLISAGFLKTDGSGNFSSVSSIPASSIVNTPAGNIIAITVQNAINEIDSEKEALANKATSYAVINNTLYPTTQASDTQMRVIADAKVEDQIVNTITTIAPSQNVVFNRLALKLDKDFTGLTSLGQGSWDGADIFAIYDDSAASVKQTTVADFDQRYVVNGGSAKLLLDDQGFAYKNDTGQDTGGYWISDGIQRLNANGQDKIEIAQSLVTIFGDALVGNDLNVTGNFTAANFTPSDYLIKNQTFNVVETASGSTSVTTQTLNIEASVDSPNDYVTLKNVLINLDPNSTGFQLGTNGNALYREAITYSHQGTANIGTLNLMSENFNIGNGTDAINSNGLFVHTINGAINNNVTVTGQIRGWTYELGLQSGVTTNQGVFPFLDIPNSSGVQSGHQSFTSGFNAVIANNSNASAFIASGNVELQGNSGWKAFSSSKHITSAATGDLGGVYINETVDSGVNYNAVYASTNGVTVSGNKYAGYFDGAVHVSGALDVQGGLTFNGPIRNTASFDTATDSLGTYAYGLNGQSGQFQVSSGFPIVASGAGTPAFIHTGFSGAGASYIFQDDVAVDYTGANIGINQHLDLPQLAVDAGKTNSMHFSLYNAGASVPAGSGDFAAASVYRALGFQQNGGTLGIADVALFRADAIASNTAGTDKWAFKDETNLENHLNKLAINTGDMKAASTMLLHVNGNSYLQGTVKTTLTNGFVYANGVGDLTTLAPPAGNTFDSLQTSDFTAACGKIYPIGANLNVQLPPLVIDCEIEIKNTGAFTITILQDGSEPIDEVNASYVTSENKRALRIKVDATGTKRYIL